MHDELKRHVLEANLELVEHAAALEEVARLAFNTVVLDGGSVPVSDALLERHFRRKHSRAAYYGQAAR